MAPVQSGRQYDARSERYGLWIEGGATEDDRRVAEALASLVRVNEGADGTARTDGSPNRSGPTLYLVPGHIGDWGDLGVRARQVLASVGLIMVERGEEERTKALLEWHGVAQTPVTTTEEVARAKDVIAEGMDVALFGGSDGIPAFCDPGRDLMRELSVEVRTVGGASVLGMVLMRSPFPIDQFDFLGTVHTADQASRAAVEVTHSTRPSILFTQGDTLSEHLVPLLSANAGMEMALFVELTTTAERVLYGAITAGLEQSLESNDACVAVFWPAANSGILHKLARIARFAAAELSARTRR